MLLMLFGATQIFKHNQVHYSPKQDFGVLFYYCFIVFYTAQNWAYVPEHESKNS